MKQKIQIIAIPPPCLSMWQFGKEFLCFKKGRRALLSGLWDSDDGTLFDDF